jgi:glycosyltransferase involved in cell wall biosynthesis
MSIDFFICRDARHLPHLFRMSSQSQRPRVSVVVTTRNEEGNIGNCLRSVRGQRYPADKLEIVVVDNSSTDRTQAIAREFTGHVYTRGPERSAQRNFGIREVASGEYVLFLDADMILAPTLLERGVRVMQKEQLAGLYIPEIVLGASVLGRIRRFERCFYDGTVVDCVRFIRRQIFLACGGFDAALHAGEDWDIDKEIRQRGSVGILGPYDEAAVNRLVRQCRAEELPQAVLDAGLDAPLLFHNESELGLWRYLRKKALYAPSYDVYVAKWGRDDSDVRKQLGVGYRFLRVFVEKGKWRRLLRHPVLATGMYALRLCVGAVFLSRHFRRRRRVRRAQEEVPG